MTKADLHRLVDQLPDVCVDIVAVYLERAKDPAVAALEATPWDDEPYTDEEHAAVEAGRAAHRRGEGIPVQDLIAELKHPDAAAG